MSLRTLRIANTAAFILMIAVNALANLLPLGGKNTGQVSAAYPNLFTPAPVTFAIWGLIYLLTGFFVLYQWGIFDGGEVSEEITESISWWFVISCALNIGWVFSWHFDQIGLSLILIVGLLISLIYIGNRISNSTGDELSYWAVNAAFDTYFGWIIAAVIANMSVWLVSIGWDRWGRSEEFWTVLALVAGALVGCAVVIFGNRWFSAMAIVWAFAGIINRHLSITGHNAAYPFIILTAFLAILLITGTMIFHAVNQPISVLPDRERIVQRR